MHGPEHKISVETHGEKTPSLERPTAQEEKSSTTEKPPNVEAIQQSIETQARSTKETQVGTHEAEAQPVIGQQRELKAEAYQGALRDLRPHLRPSERTLSKVIHQPTIETISTVAAATVGRSSGLMGGGLVALLGSGFVLFMGKYYGFEYNFFVFIATFLGGFIIGILVETLWRMLKGKQQPVG